MKALMAMRVMTTEIRPARAAQACPIRQGV
jgi:hypothetical protein